MLLFKIRGSESLPKNIGRILVKQTFDKYCFETIEDYLYMAFTYVYITLHIKNFIVS